MEKKATIKKIDKTQLYFILKGIVVGGVYWYRRQSFSVGH